MRNVTLWEARAIGVSSISGKVWGVDTGTGIPEEVKDEVTARILAAKHNNEVVDAARLALNELKSLYEVLQLRGTNGGRRIENVFAAYGEKLT